jgi:NADH-quinone oxidoreductase subunit C
MNDTPLTALEAIRKRFNAGLTTSCGESQLTVSANHIVETGQVLRDEYNFQLRDITAIDYWPEAQPRFHILYQFYAPELEQRIMLRVPLDEQEPVIDSFTTLFPNANWYEREVWDMFGIRFNGHPDPRRIMMPSDWEGHPLRKDYPLGYEEVQFTFNFDEIKQRKPQGRL